MPKTHTSGSEPSIDQSIRRRGLTTKNLFYVWILALVFLPWVVAPVADAAFNDETATRLPAASDDAYGFAVGDVDGVNGLDIVVAIRGQSRLLINDGAGNFTDETAARLPANIQDTLAVEVGDVDGVNGPDILLVGRGQNRLLINDGAGNFADETDVRLPGNTALSMDIVLRDMDGDTDLDIWTANRNSQNRLLINNGFGTFTDQSNTRLPADLDASYALVLFDADGNGTPDAFVANQEQQNRLLLNNGLGVFTDATPASLPVYAARSNDAVALDVDGDGDQDLAVADGEAGLRLLINDGAGVFAVAGAGQLPAQMEYVVRVAAGDIDFDGSMDLILGNAGQDQVLLNDGSGVFSDATAAELPTDTRRSFGVELADGDADLDLDLLVATPQGQDRYYNNALPFPRILVNVTPGYIEVTDTANINVEVFDEDGIASLGVEVIQPDLTTATPVDAGGGLWTFVPTQIGTHTARVTATDNLANEGIKDADFEVQANDVLNPAVTVTVNPGVITQGQLATFSIVATDDRTVVSRSLTVDGVGVLLDASGNASYAPLTTGTLVVVGTATDAAGNVGSDSTTIQVDPDGLAPVIGLSASPTPIDITNPIAITASATDNIGVASFGVKVTGPAGGPTDDPVVLDGAGNGSYTPFIPGTYTFTATATDPAGNTTVETAIVEAIGIPDGVAPQVTLNIVPGTTIAGGTVTLTVDATDNIFVLSRSLEINGAPIPLTGNQAQFTAPVIGDYTAIATATDPTGNVGTDTIVFSAVDPSTDTEAPVVAITSPTDSQQLTDSFDVVGTATDLSLVQYTLDYAPIGTANFTVIATGSTAVSNDVLGTIEPVVMPNGFHTLRLSAEDINGRVASTQTTISITGDTKVGNFSVSFTDLSIPVAGIPITISRTYDSRDVSNGDFGAGWKLKLSTATLEENRAAGADWFVSVGSGGFFPVYNLVEAQEHRVVVTIGDETHEFGIGVSPSSQVLTPISFVDSVFFTPLPGTTSKLFGFGSPDFLSSSGGGPTEILDSGFSLYDVNSYLLTLEDGTELFFSGTGRRAELQQITDRNGNTIQIGAGGIIHSAGLSIPFTRDAQGRITRITDPKGNTLDYTYDARGDLTAFGNRENQTTTYAYNLTHGLLEIRDPAGNVGVRQEYDADGRLIAVIDALGNRTEFARDLDLNREILTDRLGGVTIVTYDDAGNVTSRQDPDGGITSYVYDVFGNIIQTTAPDGTIRSSTFDAAGRELTTTDELGNVTVRTFDSAGRKLTETDPLGNTMTSSYDANGNVTSIVGPLGNTTTLGYDVQGNVLSTTDPLGNVSTFTYDARGNQTTVTDALGQVTTVAYDANGNIASKVNAAGETTTFGYDANDQLTRTDVDGVVRTFGYDVNRQTTSVTDANGQETLFEYDAVGNRTALLSPDGAILRWAYDAEGNLISETDRLGNVTTHTYDSASNRLSTTYPDGSTESFAYDAAGRVTRRTGRRGGVTTYGYDAAGRLIRTTDALSNVETREYNARGHRTAVIDALGQRTEFEWEVRTQDPASDRLVRTTFPDGSQSRAAYDLVGNRISATDALGNVWTYGFDALSRLISVTDPLGGVTQYEYDIDFNITAEIDAKANRTAFTYDPSGNVATTSHPLGQVKSATYDAAGRLATSTNENGDTLRYTYDAGGRLSELELSDGSVETTTWTLDDLVATVTDARGVTRYDYDATTRRLIRVTEPDGRYIRYEYDAAGNRIVTAHAKSAGDPETVTQYSYDLLGRMTQVVAPDGGVTSYSYDAAGNRLETTLPNGARTETTYDLLNRPVSVLHRAPGGAVLESFSYVLDALGNRVSETRADNSRVDYSYDALSRVLSESHYDLSATLVDNATYTYDPVGNRLTRGGSLGTVTYSYNENNQLVSENGTTYTFDAAGNIEMATNGSAVTRYGWDDRGRLTSFEPPAGGSTAYTYDRSGDRLSAAGPGGTTNYLVDRHNVTGQSQVLEESDGTGATLYTNIYGRDLLARTNGAVSYYHYDSLGSTRLLTDATGAVTDAYQFGAYGEQISHTGSSGNPYQFAGEHLDSDSGLYGLRARHYDPASGRFISRDPSFGDRLRPLTLNDYLYANGNPVNVMDPTGRFGIIGWIRAKLLGLFGGEVSQAQVGALEGSNIRPIVADISVRYAQLITIVGLADLYGSGGAYMTFFGDPGDGRIATVRKNFTKIINAEGSPIKFNFTGDDVYAYVYPGGPLEIWLGHSYFSAPLLGTDSKAGTIVHELSHEVAGTDDIVYGIGSAKQLATDDPDSAIMNADNYEYFTEHGW